MDDQKSPEEVESTVVHYQSIPNNTNRLWYKDPCLRANVGHCLGLCGVVFMNGYDGSLWNGLQNIHAWQEFLDFPTGSRLGLINAALFIPPIFFSWMADIGCHRWGRRPCVWLGVTITLAGGIINAQAHNVAMYVAGRAVMGFGTTFALIAAPTLLQEIAHPRYRAQLGGLFTCIYYIASITSSWACFGCVHMTGNWSWRIPSYLQVIGPIYVLISTARCPESPRWLISKGRNEEALNILSTYHANGVVEDPLVQHELNEIKTALQMEVASQEIRSIDFVRTKANRWRLLILFLVAFGTNWVGNGIINYYLTPTLKSVGVDSDVQIAGINVGLQVWNLILSTTAAFNMERVGRRFLWMLSNSGMFFSYIVVMALSGVYANTGKSSVGVAVIPFLFFFFGSYDVAWTPLQYSYPVEILPYFLRIKGMAIFYIMQEVAVTFNIFVNPIAMDAIGWKYYGMYIAILFCYILASYFIFPETKGKTIEEISEIFDGKKINVVATKSPDTQAIHMENSL